MSKFLFFILIVCQPLIAAIDTYQFNDPTQEKIYHALIEELRCLVCQNNNLADSNADLAKDLRRKTYKMVSSGKSHDEVIDFMVSRYGEFVLYKPLKSGKTLILWVFPLVLLIAAFAFLFWFIKNQPKTTVNLSQKSKQRAKDLLSKG